MVTKLKNLFGIWVILCMSFIVTVRAEQSYSLILNNGVQVDASSYEFDVIIKSNSGEFELTSYQVSLSFDNTFLINSNEELIFLYQTGSSDLSNQPSLSIEVFNTKEGSLFTFASFPGSDIITEEEEKIGRFIIRSTSPFSGSELNINWNKQGSIHTILTGDNFLDITNPQNHFNFLDGSTDVNDQNKNMDFHLEQNFPNPFNPTTNIKFSIPAESFIRIEIFNMLGEEITSLINQNLQSGTYIVTFNANSLPSGFYIYRLVVNDRIINTKKMLLLK